jgi:hypothetical protein
VRLCYRALAHPSFFRIVKRAYDANVPDKLTEQNFWKRFLASEFFHRSRTGSRSTNAVVDDVFDKCLREEDAGNRMMFLIFDTAGSLY